MDDCLGMLDVLLLWCLGGFVGLIVLGWLVCCCLWFFAGRC